MGGLSVITIRILPLLSKDWPHLMNHVNHRHSNINFKNSCICKFVFQGPGVLRVKFHWLLPTLDKTYDLGNKWYALGAWGLWFGKERGKMFLVKEIEAGKVFLTFFFFNLDFTTLSALFYNSQNVVWNWKGTLLSLRWITF